MKMRDRLYKKMHKKGCEVHDEVYKHLRREVQQNLSVLFVVPEWHFLRDRLLSQLGSKAQALLDIYQASWIVHLKVVPLKVNGHLTSKPKEQANILNLQFWTAFSDDRTYSRLEFGDKCKIPVKVYPVLGAVSISVKGTKKLLLNLPNFESTWPKQHQS